MADYVDRSWNSPEGIRLHYRDYAGPHDKPPILCLPGLTRNARDFEPVAERFAGDWRVIAVDYRGRGESGYDPDSSRYHPPTYVGDILKLLDQLGIAEAVFVGTSLGGIVTMLLSSTDEERIAGALINDIAPEVVDKGIDRIRTYVGQQVWFEDWNSAATAIGERMTDVYPRWGLAEWERFVRRCMKRFPDGRIGFDYDMGIGENVRAGAEEEPMSAWHLLEGLKDKPVMILRGARSDLFNADMARRMTEALPHSREVVIEDVGHAPSFDEPESLDALAWLLEEVEKRD
ncbi:alpha/beta fold hydrolase [Sphingomicrobium nitratireducens]|uniref:alpha/beta fold hydrolase n=1 Tax=Sphingomicrobium nitratireducens TaxID=2964666 RepID=UPI00223F309B|nr:alpha/beta hydrolase [Sphingomicrobium nitratireducens]